VVANCAIHRELLLLYQKGVIGFVTTGNLEEAHACSSVRRGIPFNLGLKSFAPLSAHGKFILIGRWVMKRVQNMAPKMLDFYDHFIVFYHHDVAKSQPLHLCD
jgi:hypothetical protein